MKEQLKESWKKTKDFVYRNRKEIGMICLVTAGGIVAYKILKKSTKAGELLSTTGNYDNHWEKSVFDKLGINVEWPTDGGCVPYGTRETAIEFIDKIGDGNSWIQLDVFGLDKDQIQGCIWITPKDISGTDIIEVF